VRQGAEGERGHHAEFADGEERDEAERVHTRENRLCDRGCTSCPKDTGPECGENAVRGIGSGSVRAGGSDGEDGCADAHNESATENAEPGRRPAPRSSLKKRKPQRMPRSEFEFQRGNAMLRPMSRMA